MIDNGYEVYSVGSDGKRKYVTPQHMLIDGEPLFKFDSESGVLELSMEQPLIDVFIVQVGGLPSKHFTLDVLGTRQHFEGVKEIRPLPRSDGTFFFSSRPKQSPPKKSWIRSLFG
jgi:hypothetical protein